MSRYYEMTVEVTGFALSKKYDIQAAAEEQWSFSDWYVPHSNTAMTATGQSNLCGGEDEGSFAVRVAKAIWKANGAFCQVDVRATCLEDIPYEAYSMGENDYEKLEASGQLVTGGS